MNFCFQKTTINADLIVQNAPKFQQGAHILQKHDEFDQNFSKLNIPTSITRPSSLTKLSHLCKKTALSSQKQANSKNNSSLTTKKNQLPKHILNQTNKIRTESSTKSAIVNKLLQKSKLQSKPTEIIKNKQNHNQKQKPQLQIDHFYHKHQNIDKIIKIYKEKSEKQLKQCTFNPKINRQSSARNNHSDANQFYADQIEHCKRTQDKVQQLRLLIQAEKSKQNTFKPKISEQTRQLTQRRSGNNVYERLYNQAKQSAQDQYEKVPQNLTKKHSKKSISLVSSTKKKNQVFQIYQKDESLIDVKQNAELKSKQFLRQKSVKTFTQILQGNHNKTYQSDQKPKSNNPLSSITKNTNLGKKSQQNSQKKNPVQYLGHQFLDCKQLIKQKQQTSKNLSREHSCKLINSNSKDLSHKIYIRNGNEDDRNRRDLSNSSKSKQLQKNQKITLEKFTKQFFTVVEKMTLSRLVSLNQMLSLMKNMNFIQNLEDFFEAKPQKQIKIKVFEVWSILEGEESDQISLINLFRLLSAIQGYTNGQMIQQIIRNIGGAFNIAGLDNCKDCKTLVLSQKDSKAIKKDFMNFHLTRFRLGQSKLYARQSAQNFYSFRPSISQESKEFAQKYREKIISESERLISQGAIDFKIPEDGMIDHSTLLILDKKIKGYKMEQIRLQTQRQRRKKQDESMARHSTSRKCFEQSVSTDKNKKGSRQEQISSHMFSHISHNESYSRSKDQIFTELYEQGRKSKSNRRDKSADQIEYQQSKDELTFKPKINHSRSVKELNSNINLYENIPNFTKEVMRMRKNKNPAKDDLSTSPLLYLNVSMEGNSQTKIPVFHTDDIHSITEKVRVMMKIQNGEEEKQKLKTILKQQIIPVLGQLGLKEGEGKFLSQR